MILTNLRIVLRHFFGWFEFEFWVPFPPARMSGKTHFFVLAAFRGGISEAEKKRFVAEKKRFVDEKKRFVVDSQTEKSVSWRHFRSVLRFGKKRFSQAGSIPVLLRLTSGNAPAEEKRPECAVAANEGQTGYCSCVSVFRF